MRVKLALRQDGKQELPVTLRYDGKGTQFARWKPGDLQEDYLSNLNVPAPWQALASFLKSESLQIRVIPSASPSILINFDLRGLRDALQPALAALRALSDRTPGKPMTDVDWIKTQKP